MAQQSLGVLFREGTVAQWWEPGPLKGPISFLTTLPWLAAAVLPRVLRSGPGGFKVSPHFMGKSNGQKKGPVLWLWNFAQVTVILLHKQLQDAVSQPSSGERREAGTALGKV